MSPRVSVFTASHDARFLDDCLQSLVAQTFADWEWVLVLNQGARWAVPMEDPRIRVVVIGCNADHVHIYTSPHR